MDKIIKNRFKTIFTLKGDQLNQSFNRIFEVFVKNKEETQKRCSIEVVIL